MKLNQEQFFGIVRHVVGAVGGIGMATGYGTGSQWEAGAGAIATIAALLWSLKSNK